jgi:hypothetical protein
MLRMWWETIDLEVGSKCVDWIELAKDRDQLLTFVNTVMNFQVS